MQDVCCSCSKAVRRAFVAKVLRAQRAWVQSLPLRRGPGAPAPKALPAAPSTPCRRESSLPAPTTPPVHTDPRRRHLVPSALDVPTDLVHAAAEWCTGAVVGCSGSFAADVAASWSPRTRGVMSRAYQASLSAPGSGSASLPAVSSRRHVGTTTALRSRVAAAFQAWAITADGRAARKRRRDVSSFARCYWSLPVGRAVPKNLLNLVRRSVAVASVPQGQLRRSLGGPRQGRGAAHRQRQSVQQGRPERMPEVSVRLFDWFVDVRGTIRGRMPSHVLFAKAQLFLSEACRAMVRSGEIPEPPKLSKAWLCRWKQRWGVSTRQPNKRFKISHAAVMDRLQTFYWNVHAVRCLLRLLRGGREPVQESADQKGLHFNESGSRGAATLALTGVQEVQVVENHMQTRERYSIMTHCVSDLAAIPGGHLWLFCSRA
jgi:hypothetical protein